VLDQAALDQWQFGHRRVQCALRRRGEEILCQPRQESRQIPEMVTHLRRTQQRVAQDLAEIARKHVRKNRGAFDQAAIAVTGFLAGHLVPVDQNHIPAAFLQVQGGAHADHARTQDEYVGLQFRHPGTPKV
jgi:hypothetical protein